MIKRTLIRKSPRVLKRNNPEDILELYNTALGKDLKKARKAALTLRLHFSSHPKYNDYWPIIREYTNLNASDIDFAIAKVILKTSGRDKVKNPVSKIRIKRNPVPKDVILLTESNLKKYGPKLIGNNDRELGPLLKFFRDIKFLIKEGRYSPNIMEKFDQLLGNYGVETTKGKTPADKFVYSNTGDSYALTIIYYQGKYYIGGWADIVEANQDQY